MVVIGGFNSSNTISLAAICADTVPTYHIGDAGGIEPDSGTIHFRKAGVQHVEESRPAWLPPVGPLRIGVTAGASTPNNKIGEAVARIFMSRGIDPTTIA